VSRAFHELDVRHPVLRRERHLELLRRWTDSFTLVLDGDEAVARAREVGLL
jgi:hypothetical protein